MNPSSPSSTPTSAVAPEALRPWRGTAVPQLDTVKVSSETFRKVMFMGSAERKEFTRERVPNVEKPQKRTSAGMALWSVKVAVENWRGKTELITITVPMHDDPGTKFTVGQ